MKSRFERAALGVVAGLVTASVAAMVFRPPAPVTAAPRVVLDVPAKARPRQAGFAEVVMVPARAASPRPRSLFDSRSLRDSFRRIGYDLDRVAAGETPVPRIFLASFPSDLHELREVDFRKEVFFKTVLPLILKENERIRADRERLWKIVARERIGRRVDAADRLWRAALADRYKVDRDDTASLLARVDVIPPSLALAQAAEESGWGTSRFARRGNALFGQWTTADDDGLVPRDRDEGKTHRVKAFGDLGGSVAAYMRNLNTHRAYRGFRKLRAAARARGAALSGPELAAGLTKYSERGKDYVKALRALISVNNLAVLDEARLEKSSPRNVASSI